jgi:hypothetical protein
VVEVSTDGRRVVRATTALDIKCGSQNAVIGDAFVQLPLSKSGRFRGSYGPVRVDNADGSFDVVTGSMTGASNRARTKLSGTWRLIDVEHDAAGNVTNTCDSGTVHWTAKQ